jgi:hypothetical protein
VKKKRIVPTTEGEIIVPIYRRRDETDFLNYGTYHCYRPHTTFIQYLSVKVNSACRKNYWYSSARISTTYQQEQETKPNKGKALNSIQVMLIVINRSRKIFTHT